MIELLRNCSHAGGTATYLVTKGDQAKVIVKCSDDVAGILNINREISGWKWYQEARYPDRENPICRVVKNREGFRKIEIDFIDGFRPDYRRGMRENRAILKKVIEHYSQIWPFYPGGQSVLHGDLSLDNIIYNSEGVHIIDWEHFSLKGAPCGFDAIYMLFESLYFGMRQRKHLLAGELDVIIDCLVKLNKGGRLSSCFIESPLKACRDFIFSNIELWGRDLPVLSGKLPVCNFTEEQVFSIDRAIFNLVKAVI